MGSFVVGTRGQIKIQVLTRVIAGEITQKKAKQLLKISERTLRRWLIKYKQKGMGFLVHGNKGRKPINAKPLELKYQITHLVRTEFYDFNMTHCLEKLRETMPVSFSRETFRKWCHQSKLVKNMHRRRRKKIRYKRQRFSQFGFLLQLDGSHHRWFNNEESCLIAVIDDATSKVLSGLFFDQETTSGTFAVLKKIFEQYGLPSILYVDRAGVYGGIKRHNFSQLVRALEELQVQIVYADSPEGKGRVERLFKTLQDRLIPEMRKAGIKDKASANKYLNEIYLPHLHNARFSVIPQDLKPAWREVPRNINIHEVLCIKEYRRVANDHTFSFKNNTYLITTDLKYAINNHDIEVRINDHQQMEVSFAGRTLSFKKIERKNY